MQTNREFGKLIRMRHSTYVLLPIDFVYANNLDEETYIERTIGETWVTFRTLKGLEGKN